jgi:hypothetical protein
MSTSKDVQFFLLRMRQNKRHSTKRKQADKYTCKEKNKNNERKQHRKKHKWKRAECDHVKKAEKKQRSRILQAYENKISYTPEDGQVG